MYAVTSTVTLAVPVLPLESVTVALSVTLPETGITPVVVSMSLYVPMPVMARLYERMVDPYAPVKAAEILNLLRPRR